jgi:hypothetical protein
MSERFTEILRAASEPAWSDAVRHRFVNELFAGGVPDAVMARYLIQDHRFLGRQVRVAADRKIKPYGADALHLDEDENVSGMDGHSLECEAKMLAEPFASFTFSPAGASVYQLGSFGTARKELRALTLTP